jgi:hypothetical protein
MLESAFAPIDEFSEVIVQYNELSRLNNKVILENMVLKYYGKYYHV